MQSELKEMTSVESVIVYGLWIRYILQFFALVFTQVMGYVTTSEHSKVSNIVALKSSSFTLSYFEVIAIKLICNKRRHIFHVFI